VAKPELGIKRQCISCGAKFYDLGRDPAMCPRCGTTFQATALAAAMSRGAAAPVAARAPARVEEDAEVEPAGPELVSLEDVEAAEVAKDEVADDEIEISEGTEDTFLEEEEESEDDVSGLIDGDIEDDEET
jgi:uncharacterized protein (TIGR02300 family)